MLTDTDKNVITTSSAAELRLSLKWAMDEDDHEYASAIARELLRRESQYTTSAID